MGKGKAKGFRPPAANDPNAGMLLGSAAHLTGDTVASPVQLRAEGRALPEGHLNFGDEWGKGNKGKGKGKDKDKGKASSSTPAEEPPKLLKASAKGAASKPADQAAKAAPKPTTPTVPIASKPMTEIERRRLAMSQQQKQAAPTAPKEEPPATDGLSEIERRRAAMLAKQKQAQAAVQESADDGLSVIERRRLERQRQLQAQLEAEDDEDLTNPEVKDEVLEEAAGDHVEEGEGEYEYEDEDEEDEVSRAAARREREEEDEQEEEPPAKAAKTEGGPSAPAMKLGLQDWAARVNDLAPDPECELAQKCRDFVRRRILRAHAEGNLHAVNWGEEPTPSLDELMAL